MVDAPNGGPEDPADTLGHEAQDAITDVIDRAPDDAHRAGIYARTAAYALTELLVMTVQVKGPDAAMRLFQLTITEALEEMAARTGLKVAFGEMELPTTEADDD